MSRFTFYITGQCVTGGEPGSVWRQRRGRIVFNLWNGVTLPHLRDEACVVAASSLADQYGRPPQRYTGGVPLVLDNSSLV